ncbi:uncharacterized protein LOC119730444 [Patiria miniata]|uniref:Uncharacterized protein n=1 Tax=Patiria miniata TaxID=46514 RepID=A0A914A631_PATMI|nr:uncharacterized protein LOC119730444 [Patiria miniata]XP_038059264.1 uncharacterized protein LOC119730444 [Patiria miniata]
MVCFLSSIQGPVQATMRPAMWVPGVKLVHSHREKWDCPNTLPGVCVEELIKAVDRVQSLESTNGTFFVNKVDREKFRVQIFNWTWAEWLDVVEIEFKHGQEQGTEAECLSFSSGFLPTWFPLCFIFNSVFCFLPFWDKHFNRDRLHSLRSAMQIACKLQDGDKELQDPLI